MIPLEEVAEVSSPTEQSESREHDAKVAEEQVNAKRWKGVSITVTTLLGYAFLNAGVSMISPFYPIVAKKHNVATYIVGIVIGVAPLSMTVLSSLIGYFLPHLGMKFTQLAGLLLAGGSLILFGQVVERERATH